MAPNTAPGARSHRGAALPPSCHPVPSGCSPAIPLGTVLCGPSGSPRCPLSLLGLPLCKQSPHNAPCTSTIVPLRSSQCLLSHWGLPNVLFGSPQCPLSHLDLPLRHLSPPDSLFRSPAVPSNPLHAPSQSPNAPTPVPHRPFQPHIPLPPPIPSLSKSLSPTPVSPLVPTSPLPFSNPLPPWWHSLSFRIPTSRHFWRRHAWHCRRLALVMGQLRVKGQVKCTPLRMERLGVMGIWGCGSGGRGVMGCGDVRTWTRGAMGQRDGGTWRYGTGGHGDIGQGDMGSSGYGLGDNGDIGAMGQGDGGIWGRGTRGCGDGDVGQGDMELETWGGDRGAWEYGMWGHEDVETGGCGTREYGTGGRGGRAEP